MKKAVRIILIIVFSAAILVSGYKLLSAYLGYKEADDFYDGIREDFIVIPETEAVTDKLTTEAGKEDTALSDTTAKEENGGDGDTPFGVDFDGLCAYCPDVVGWIYCPGTPISYPVAQSDDNDYYLRRALDGSHLVTGTIFADFRNTVPMAERNYIVYGHYMKDGSIFGCFEKYKSQSYYESHPVMYYFTPGGDYEIELFAGVLTSTSEFSYRTDMSDKRFAELIGWAKEKSFFDSSVEVGPEDKIITLSTCSYEYENARFVLLGKLVLMN